MLLILAENNLMGRLQIKGKITGNYMLVTPKSISKARGLRATAILLVGNIKLSPEAATELSRCFIVPNTREEFRRYKRLINKITESVEA